MAELFLKWAEEKPDEAALIDEFGQTTWRDYNGRVNRLVHALRAAGLEKGAKVAVLASNRREYFEALGATSHGSYLVVPVNWHFVAEEIAYIIEDSGAEALIADARFSELAVDAIKDIEGLKLKLAFGGEADGFDDYETFLADGSPEEPDGQGFGSIMFYTSGTTGRPKGVLSTSVDTIGQPVSELAGMMELAADTVQVPRGGRSLLCGPVYHSAQWAFSWIPFTIGSPVIMQHKFDPPETLRMIDDFEITNSHMVPTQFVRFLKYRDGAGGDIQFEGSSLKHIWHGAAPCSPAIKKQMIEWWGPIISEYYGGTEGGFMTFIKSDEWLQHPGSVGKPTAANELMIVDDDGTACPEGQPGTIYQKSLLGSDFSYHNKPEETEKRHLAPGVFTLGDVGFLDKDGYLFLTDRQIDMIISGGVNIYPAEIESALVAHPKVHDVAVFGIPNEEFGEEIKAVVELTDGTTGDDALTADLVSYATDHLAKYKIPRSWDFTTELPRTPTGKLYKRLLRDPYWEGKDKAI